MHMQWVSSALLPALQLLHQQPGSANLEPNDLESILPMPHFLPLKNSSDVCPREFSVREFWEKLRIRCSGRSLREGRACMGRAGPALGAAITQTFTELASDCKALFSLPLGGDNDDSDNYKGR